MRLSPGAQRGAKDFAKRHVKPLLGAGADEPVYPRLEWLKARLQGIRSRQGLFQGHRIEGDSPMHASCVPFDIAGPGPGEVLIRTTVSAISPGTEVAFLSCLPNTETTFPFYPGYSAAGEIVAVGRGVAHLTVGQTVAGAARHASLARIPARAAFALPAGVTAQDAAFIQLGVIAYHGLWRSELAAGESVAVFGRGIIGQLALQLARAAGARTVVSIAPSARNVTEVLLRSAERILTTGESGGAALGDLDVDVAFEASGHPSAIRDAIAATRDGGRVVLLGSTRGVTEAVDFGSLADRGVTLIGANIRSLGSGADRARHGRHTYREAGTAFMNAIANGQLALRELVTTSVNPWEAGWFYRRLAEGSLHCVGALFQWDELDDDDRMKTVSYWAAPNLEAMRGRKMLRTDVGHLSPQPQPQPQEAPSDGRGGGAARPLRVALIGCGERGAGNAADVQRANGTTLATVMDLHRAAAERVGQQRGVPWTTDFEAVLADPGVDAVFINTPHFLHAQQAIRAAQAGKHVIVEKPLATTVEDAQRMAEAASAAGVQLAAWLGFRYVPEVVKAKQLIDAGALGTILGARLTFQNYKPASYWRGGPSGRGTDWRARWDTCGGGVLIMTGIHYLDWLLHLSGLRVREVSARYATLNSPAEVEDSIAMWLELENGALATVDMATCVQGGIAPIVELRLWGTEGHLSLAPPHQWFSTRMIDGRRPERWNSLDPLPKLRRPSVEFLDRFARAVREGVPAEVSARDALDLQAVIEAAYRSSREGRPVTVAYPAVSGTVPTPAALRAPALVQP